MSLVAAYAASSDEDSGDESISAKPMLTFNNKSKRISLPPPTQKATAEKEEPRKQQQEKSMFTLLPAPKRNFLADLVEETDDPILNVKQTVKITIPSLSQFKKDEEEDAPKPKKEKLAPRGSGLLALLPEPVNSVTSRKAFLPHVLTKKPTPAPKPPVKKPVPAKPPTLVMNYSESEDESGDEGEGVLASKASSGIDFFSLTNQVQPVPAVIDLDEFRPQAGPSRPINIPESTYAVVDEEIWEENVPEAEEKELSDEAIRKLCGKRAEEIGNMIDIQGATVYAEAKDWMLKNMTEEPEKDYSHRDNTPNPTMKRKHHITQLAFQAKENETELKNQWASNRMSKKQTQAKYGF